MYQLLEKGAWILLYFPSKKDVWLYPIIWGSIIVCFIPIFTGSDLKVLFFTIPCAFLLGWTWFKTGYEVTPGYVTVQSGPIKKKIPIYEIKKISKTKNPLSAPALSLDRLEINYGQFGMALVSPKDKQKFISLLTSINSKIEVDN